MTADRVKSIFMDALDLPVAERESFVHRESHDDAHIAQRVLALLAAHDNTDDFCSDDTMDKPGGHTSPPSDSSSLAAGDMVGPYTIVRRLGEGGFAIVYEAQQHEPVRRLVALKVLKSGIHNEQILQRFEHERHTLALMDHPNIARVLDAGASDDGRPYVAMELVNGQPITEFCDEHKLPVRHRLELFARVCLAVHHAHQKGVIHRDIKPSNVMVREVSGTIEPSIIDFGVAKALDDSELSHPDITMARQIIGTPHYMSPEQATLNHKAIDTRTDVYSLGVLLYELLAGITPFRDATDGRQSMQSLLDDIRDTAPPRPSTRIMSLGDLTDSVAEARSQDAHRLWRELKGDLDWIVLRALEKEQQRRYPSAFALAEDIHRHLRHEPVVAGPPRTTYRIGKFARRHVVEVVATCVLLLSLCALGTGGILFGLRERAAATEIQTQLETSDALASFAQSIIRGVDPAVVQEADTTVLRNILGRAVDRVDVELRDQPHPAVDMLNTIGIAYLQIGAYDDAETTFREAMTIAATEIGAESEPALDARSNLAQAYVGLSRFDEAVETMEPLVDAHVRQYGESSDDVLSARGNLAAMLQHAGRYEDARVMHEQVLAARRDRHGDAHEDTQTSMNNLAIVYSELDMRGEAIELYEAVYEHQARTDGLTHRRTLMTMNNLASAYGAVGRLDDAERMLMDVLQAKRAILTEDHPSLLVTMANLASVRVELKRYDDAETMFRDALAISRRTLTDKHMHTITLLNQLGMCLREQERYDDALPVIEEAHTLMQQLVDADHPNAIRMAVNYMIILRYAGEYDAAIDIGDTTLPIARRAYGPRHRTTLDIERTRGHALAALGDHTTAIAELDALYRAVVRETDAHHPESIKLAGALEDICTSAGDHDAASSWAARQAESSSDD
ncbi:MAG: serine/threonine-protein kinase [Planctomycetota bacterium]